MGKRLFYVALLLVSIAMLLWTTALFFGIVSQPTVQTGDIRDTTIYGRDQNIITFTTAGVQGNADGQAVKWLEALTAAMGLIAAVIGLADTRGRDGEKEVFLPKTLALLITAVLLPLTAVAETGNISETNIHAQNGNVIIPNTGILQDGAVELNTISFENLIYIENYVGEYRAYTLESVVEHYALSTKGADMKEELRGWDGRSYQYVLFGTYDQQDGYQEPILWRVLYTDHRKALLLSEYVLDTRAFDSVAPYWNGSDMKSWLNGAFYESAFTTSAQRESLLYNDELGAVFLLAKNDYLKAEYGFSKKPDVEDMRRRARGSAYAANHGLWIGENETCSYYTRTSENNTTLWQVRASGAMGGARYDRENVGVRPAVWIDLDKTVFNVGQGTREFPFQEAQKP